MRSGSINIKQAAEALGMEPAMLAYQLAGKVSQTASGVSAEPLSFQVGGGRESNGNDDIAEEEEENYDDTLMEVQPDIIMNEEEQEEHFDSIIEEEGVDPIGGTS